MKRDKNFNIIVSKHQKNVWYGALALTIAMMIIPPLLGRYHFIIDLFSHFQLQLSILLFLLLILGALIRVKGVILLSILLFLAVHFSMLINPVQLRSNLNSMDRKPDLYYMNSFYFQNDIASILGEISDKKAPIVALVEANDLILGEVEQIYGKPVSIEGAYASRCVIFSSVTIEEYAINQNEFTYPICTTKVDSTVIVLIHPLPPLSGSFFNQQKQYFSEIDTLIARIISEDLNFILLGDFNSTYYSSIFRESFGEYFEQNIYSWSVHKPWSIPIDHALSNQKIQIYRTNQLSSDHVGYFIKLEDNPISHWE